jgi:Fic family protein
VRVINCYYSNLIEGHNTRPKDIERALVDDFDADEKRRSLQLEARAHIRIQERIDNQAADNSLGDPACIEFIQRLHLDFYNDAPESIFY